jgi:serine/threonine protein kinase
MPTPSRTCSSCNTPLPGDAAFCPGCGAATPTDLNVAFGERFQDRPRADHHGQPMPTCASCSADLDPSAAFCPSCGAPAAPTPASGAVGDEIGGEDEFREQLQHALGARYELKQLIGRGGFGAVYSARDTKLGRLVAVKSILPGLLAWSGFLDRFRQEARLLAKLRHVNVVEVFDFGEQDQLAYMVMPLITGDTLEQRLGREPLVTPEEAVPIMRDVAEGLLAAHERRIVHRDVKPSNIIWDKAIGRWRVMDFGIAKTEYSRLVGLTSAGTPTGTPLYMAPEQAEDPTRSDSRADIYGYGATFYRALTGQPPFEGTSPLSVLIKAKMDPLVSPRSLNPTIPAFLNDCIERCLAKEPASRLQSFRDVLTVLRDAGSGGPSAWDLPSDPISNEAVARYQDRRSVYLDVSGAALDEPDVYPLPNGRRVTIAHGDITDQHVGAIVSSDDNFLSMGGGVSGRILTVGGPTIAEEAKRFVPIRPGRVVVTTAGNLPASFVLHGVTLGFEPEHWGTKIRFGVTVEPSRDLISEIVDGCFYHAETLQLESIAFPLLGTGAGGFARDVCLDTLFRVLLRKLLFGVTSVREAHIVI